MKTEPSPKESMPRVESLPLESVASKTDPSVRLGPLQGEPLGSVPMNVTMGRPKAYEPKPGPK